MRGKKILFLVLALLLPIAVFLFLKIFGKNEFSVEPFYQKGLIKIPAECNEGILRTPYTIADTVFQRLTTGVDSAINAKFVIFPFSSGENTMHSEAARQMNRVLNEFQGEDIFVKWILERDSSWHRYVKKCVFFMKADSDVVVLDKERRIRGYYVGSSREDVDRLIVELKIMLKKY